MKCDESLRPLCNAILKNIDKYPFKPQLSNYYKTEEYQKKRHPNKQSKGANTEYVKNPISEYPITDDANERLHYTTMELARANSKLLSALTPDILDAILTFGNVTAVEYFKFMIDPTYQNPNLEDPNNARKFYFLTYKHFFKSISLENNELKLFHYFTVESILKGTILFSFCNFFCNNTWDRFIKNIGGLDSENGKKIISGIFKNINTIDNPFLKELIIEKILPDSYYHKFNYNGNEYDAGKNDHDKWSIFINDLCSSVCQIEKRIYPILLFYHYNDLIKINEKSDALNQYENLFAKNIYDIKLNKEIPTSRSNRFPKLLKIALLASFHWGKLDIFQNSLPK